MYACAENTPAGAAASGRVRTVGDDPHNLGHYLIISHSRNRETLYAHLSTISVTEGERIEEGQIIAVTGISGRATAASQLRFGVFMNGEAQDPEPFFTAE